MSLFEAPFKPFYILESLCIPALSVFVAFGKEKKTLNIKEATFAEEESKIKGNKRASIQLDN